MKCLMCTEKAEYICICEFIPLCGEHITPHQRMPGSHNLEYINIPLSGSKYYDLQIKALNLFKLMEGSKNQIKSMTKTLIKKILTISNSTVKYLDLYSRICLLLMSLERVSESLKSQADIILTHKFKVKQININIDSFLEQEYYTDLVTHEDSNLYQRSNSLINSLEENRFAEELKSSIDEAKLKRLGTLDEKDFRQELFNVEANLRSVKTEAQKDYRQNSNIIEEILEEKKKLLASFDIENYEFTFGKGKYYSDKIQEIKFSNDNKFAFVCEAYLGIFK